MQQSSIICHDRLLLPITTSDMSAAQKTALPDTYKHRNIDTTHNADGKLTLLRQTCSHLCVEHTALSLQFKKKEETAVNRHCGRPYGSNLSTTLPIKGWLGGGAELPTAKYTLPRPQSHPLHPLPTLSTPTDCHGACVNCRNIPVQRDQFFFF